MNVLPSPELLSLIIEEVYNFFNILCIVFHLCLHVQACFPLSKPSTKLQVFSYLMSVKLIFDFLHIIWHLLLHLEGILCWQ